MWSRTTAWKLPASAPNIIDVLAARPVSAGVRYVQCDVTGAGHSTSWTDAYTDLLGVLRFQLPDERVFGGCRWPDPQLTDQRYVDWRKRVDHYNLLFDDGHASFTRVSKGKYLTGQYSAIPFHNAQNEARQCQPKDSVN